MIQVSECSESLDEQRLDFFIVLMKKKVAKLVLMRSVSQSMSEHIVTNVLSCASTS